MILFVYIIFCKEKGKEYLRLDSLRGNETLEDYYSMRGFVEKGHVLIEIMMVF